MKFLLLFILGLQGLHNAGYRGEGMTIAVIDCGFFGADSAAFFPQEQIVGAYDLVEDSLREYGMFESSADNHGTLCLSTMLYRSEQFRQYGCSREGRFTRSPLARPAITRRI